MGEILRLPSGCGHSLSLDPKTGALRYESGEGQAPALCGSWVRAAFREAPDSETLDAGGFGVLRASVAGDSLLFTMRGGGAEVEGEWKARGWGFELHATVRNTGGRLLHCVGFRFPAAGMPGDASFALPHGAGFLVPAWELGADQCVRLHYPVYCSMQWIDICASESGIYLGVCDTLPRSKFFVAGREGGVPYLAVDFPDLMLAPGESDALPAVQLMAHAGDWSAGASHYGSWFESAFTKPEAPAWCREMPAWAWASCKGQNADEPETAYGRLAGHSRQFFDIGAPVLQVAGYLENGHDSGYPDYEAAGCMGGEEGLASAAAEIHAAGGRLALYTNGRIADPRSSIREAEGWAGWCVAGVSPKHLDMLNDEYRYTDINASFHATDWDRAGTVFKEKYGNVEFAVMCPASPQWRDFYIGKLESLARRYGLDGIYLDQVCGAWGMVCYARGHEHARPYEAWSGYVKLLAELRQRLLARKGDTYLATEGVNDILGLHIDLFQAHDWDFRIGLPRCAQPAPELFITALPGYLLYLGPVFKDDYTALRRAFVYGRGVDIAIKDLAECEESFVDELRFFLAMRKRHCPGLLSAVPRLLLEQGGARCYAYELPDSRSVVLGAMLSGLETAEDTYIPGKPECAGRSAALYTPSSVSQVVCDENGGITIPRGSRLWCVEACLG